MSDSINFSSFSRQSPKGILVIYSNLIYKLVKFTWVLLFLILKDFSKISNVGANYMYIGTSSVLIFLFIRAFLQYKNFQFKIENNHFILQQGILKKTNTSIPFHRIQNINFKQNIVQQIINVFEVGIETAGSKKTEIAIKALSLARAKKLKQLIADQTQIHQELSKEKEDIPLLRIGFKELFKVSLTENHLQNLFLFFAVILGFFQQIQQIIDGFGETEALDGFISESTNAVSTNLFIAFTLGVLLIIIAFVSSFVRILLRHFNLITYLKTDSFEINQGLFTKKSVVLKKQKVQNITISTNPLKRWVGISFVTFKQAVSGKLQHQKKDKLIRIVGCQKEQIKTIKKSLFETAELESKEKTEPHTYYKRRLLIIASVILILSYMAIFLIFESVEILFSFFLIAPIVVFLILKKVKKRYYKISDSMLLVGRGLLETHITYLEFFKVQNIKMKQTIFQKRSNVADVILQTASGKIKIPCMQIQDAHNIYNHTLYKVETSTTSWM